MSDEEVRDLVENQDEVAVGNHTKSHPHLSRIGGEEELRRQIVGAKEDLEDRFGVDVDRFCYPSGDFDEEALDVVRQSHEIAVSTIPRVINQDRLGSGGYDKYTLPRIAAHNSKARVRWEMSDVGSSIRDRAKSSGLASR